MNLLEVEWNIWIIYCICGVLIMNEKPMWKCLSINSHWTAVSNWRIYNKLATKVSSARFVDQVSLVKQNYKIYDPAIEMKWILNRNVIFIENYPCLSSSTLLSIVINHINHTKTELQTKHQCWNKRVQTKNVVKCVKLQLNLPMMPIYRSE